MNIVIRADASIYIGSGHIMRCLVLASVLKEHGHQVSFASRPQQGDLIDFVRNKGFLVKELVAPTHWLIPKDSADYAAWLQVPWQEDAQSFFQQVDSVDIVIVDHYGLNSEWEALCRAHLECKLFAIDDLLRQHQAEVVLDQTLSRTAIDYRQLNANGIALTGCDFALLNSNFAKYRKKALQTSLLPLQPKVLVSMGGIDQPNATLQTLKTLSSIKGDKPLLTVLLSPKAPHYQIVKNFCTEQSSWITHVDFVENMAELMLNHHVAIGAPGTTSWERACLGLPNIIVPLADNQRTISEQLVKVGAAIKVDLSDLSRQLLTAYQTMLDSWDHMRLANLSLCDGLGVFRVTHCINQLSENNNNQIVLKAASESDTKQVYDWQVLPETRKYALTQDTPTWEGHQKWMKAKLAATSDYFYMIESLLVEENVGVVRLDKKIDNRYLISIFIDPKYFGQGVAKQALAYVDLLHSNITIEATVLAENIASQRLFTTANYYQVAPDSFVRSPLNREIK